MEVIRLAFLSEHASVALPTSYEDLWEMQKNMLLKAKLGTALKEQEKSMNTVKDIHGGEGTEANAASASAARTSEEANTEEADRQTAIANGAELPPQPSVTVGAPPAVTGTGVQPDVRGRASIRNASHSRSPPPGRIKSPEPKKGEDMGTTAHRDPKRGSETQGTQLTPDKPDNAQREADLANAGLLN